MTIDTITREALVEKLKQYPTLLQQFLVLVDTQGTTLDDIQEILKLAEEAENNAVKAQTSATIAQEEAEKSSTSASKVDAFDERIIKLENSTAKVKEENTFTQVNNFNSGIKTDKVKTSGGLDIINHDGTNINIGNSSKTLKLTGSQSRPTYKEQDIALLSDVNSSFRTAIRYTDSETTERKAQDTTLQTNIDKKANTTDLDTLKSTVNSNWSLLMANLGIGRWANQDLISKYWDTEPTIIDGMINYYTSHIRFCAFTRFIGSNGTIHKDKNIRIFPELNSSITGKTSWDYAFYKFQNECGINFNCVNDYVMSSFYFCFGANITSFNTGSGVLYVDSRQPYQMFSNCPNITEIGTLDLSSAVIGSNGLSSCFVNCPNLKYIHLKDGSTIRCSFTLSSTGMERDGLIDFLSHLTTPVSTTENVVRLGTDKLSLLTEEEKVAITDKGWVLA